MFSGKWQKVVFGILAGLFTIGIVIYVTGLWDRVGSLFSSEVVWNIVLIVIIIGAVVAVVLTSKDK